MSHSSLVRRLSLRQPSFRCLPLGRAVVPVVALSVLAAFAPPSRAQAALAADAAAAPDATAEQTAQNAAVVLVTAIRGKEATLGAGSEDGVQVGAIYGVTRGGTIRARLRVTAVRPTESTATIFGVRDDFVVTVGDTALFILVEPPGTLPATPDTPTTPDVPVTPPVTPPTTPPNTAPPTVAVPPAAPGTGSVTTMPDTGATAVISAVSGKTVTLGAGANQGVRAGSNLPVLREGNVVAIVRVQTVSPDSSTGIVTWSDDPDALLVVGDTARIFAAPAVPATPDTGAPAPDTVIEPGRAPLPAAPMLYESGLSNAVVPRADRTYEYLAALAASRLITRYAPHVFHDDGTRRHRSDEDLTFTRAEIAGLVRDALQTVAAAGEDARPGAGIRTALGALSQDYARELRALGVTPETLALVAPRKRFEFGISGQSRISLVGGDTDSAIEPFSERQGGRRSRSGFDSRTNIFARSGENLRFFATIDSGSRASRANNDDGFEVRRALLSYNANRLLRGLTVEVGRNEYWWGPGHFGTLLLSDVAGPLNSLHTVFKRGSYQLEGLYAPLGRGPLGGSRSLYGHNLQVRIGSQTRIGIAETVLLPKEEFDPLLFAAAFSPVPLFTIERQRGNNTSPSSGQALIKFYAETSIARGAQVYGEFLLDDIGINQTNLERNRLGTLLGAHLFKPGDPGKLGIYAEYTNLQGRTYLSFQRLVSDSDYYYRGDPLGYPVAPTPGAGNGGAESLRFDAYWRPTPRLRLSLGAEFADIGSEEPIISRQQVYRLRAAYDLTRNITLVGRLQRVSTDNPGNAFGPGVRQNLFQLQLVRAF